MNVKIFINNPWQENTYLLYDETGEAVIIDCGCYNDQEKENIKSFLKDNNLNLVKLLNTHLHIDHVFGNSFINEEFGLKTTAEKSDNYLVEEAPRYAAMLGLQGIEAPPAVGEFISEGDIIRFGNTELKVIHTPGHTPGGVCYYCEKDKVIFVGDSLFEGSIGRTDLPGGSYDDLIDSLKNKVIVLDEDVKVYSGHGPASSIGYERHTNPFLK